MLICERISLKKGILGGKFVLIAMAQKGTGSGSMKMLTDLNTELGKQKTIDPDRGHCVPLPVVSIQISQHSSSFRQLLQEDSLQVQKLRQKIILNLIVLFAELWADKTGGSTAGAHGHCGRLALLHFSQKKRKNYPGNDRLNCKVFL
jgi:hypothetical protein